MLKRTLTPFLFPLLLLAQAPKVQVVTRAGSEAQLTTAQGDKKFTAPQHAAYSSQLSWRQKETATTSLTYGYFSGAAFNGTTWDSVGDGTVTLVASQTNYVQRTPAGAVSANTTVWTAGSLPMVSVVTGTASITSLMDYQGDSLGPLASTGTSQGAALIPYLAPYTGAVATTQALANANHVLNPVVSFGCPSNGTSDCSASVNLALAALGTDGLLEFPAGTFKMNIDLAGKRVSFRGMGQNATKLVPYNTASPVIIVGANVTWDSIEFNDLTISSSGNVGVGVQFGHASYITNDEFAGRAVFRRVKMKGFDICIKRLYGNIGVYLERCTFENANYHIWSVGHSSPIMQAGTFHATDCHFQLAALAHHYMDSPQTGSGDVIYTGCTHESNPGFVFYIKNFSTVAPAPGFIVDKCWNESNYTAASVTVNSTVYTPPVYAYIANASSVLFTATPVGPMTIVASDVKVEKTNIDMTTTGSGAARATNSTIDPASTLTFEDVEQDLSINMTYNRMPRRFNRNTAMSRVKHRNWASSIFSAQAVSVGRNDCTIPITFGGTGAGTTTTVLSDGTLFPAAQDLTLSSTPGNTHLDTNGADYISAVSGNYQVYCLTYKLMSGVFPTSINWSGGVGLSSPFPNSSSWVTVMGMSKSGASSPCYLAITSAGKGVLRLGGFFIIEFTTKQAALEFMESGCFPETPSMGASVGAQVTSANTITPTGTVFHMTGATVVKRINLPYTGFKGHITIIPDSAYTTDATGNISIASTAVINKAMIMTWDGTKWYPSY